MRAIVLLLLLAQSAFAGDTKAVVEISRVNGVKLTEVAIKRLGIEWTPLQAKRVPASSIVRYQDATGVYVYRGGYFKLTKPSDVEPGDLVVFSGAAAIRLAEIDAESPAEGGNGD